MDNSKKMKETFIDFNDTITCSIIDKNFDVSHCYTNDFLPQVPYSDLKPIACCLEVEE